MARGVWSLTESPLYIEHLCRDQIVLIATDSTSVVFYINKEGGMIQTPFVPLRLLSWCHPRGIVPRSWHIPGRLNVMADKLSRRSQVTRQSGPYLKFSTSGAQDGLGHMWSFLQPGSITNSPSLFHRYRIQQTGQ